MSLVVWLPLTKDLRQQGLSNATVTNNGATFDSMGKLGGCYNFTNQNIVIPSNNFKSEFTNNQASLAAWVKVTTSHSAYAQALVLGTQGTSWNNILFGIDINGSGTPIANASTGSAYTNLSFGTAIKDGVWHHITYTYNAGTMKVYLDGVQKATTTTSNTPAWTNSTNLYIGGNSGGEKFQNGDSMNDVRLYNHCLSPMEVKELAKGLVLHYPLNRNGFGCENLVTGTSNILRSGSIGQYYTSLGHNSTTFFGLSAGDIVTFRIYLKAPIAKKVRARIQFYNSDSDRPNLHGNYINAGEEGYSTITWTLTATQRAYSQMQLLCDCNDGTTTTDTFYWKELKLEKSSVATPWCPNSSDTLATTMGLNSTTEYDCSGFCNNGTRTGTFTWTSDTPKYQVSTNFIKGTKINSATGMIIASNPIFTCNFWVNTPTGTYTQYSDIVTFKGSAQFRMETSNTTGTQLTWFNYPIGTSNGINTNGAVSNNTWNMFTITCDGTNWKTYKNGVLATTTAISGTAWTPDGTVSLGDSGTLMKMSDFRIYATALSADDVKSLYQNSAYIDSSGNVYGAVHSEV